ILVAAVGLDIVLACMGLVLLRLDRPVLAAAVFIYGALAVGVLYLVCAPAGLDELVLLVFATLTLLILIAGLVLPIVMIWVTAGLVIAVTSAGMLTLPIAASLTLGATSQMVRASGLALLVGIQSLAALISWVSASSARAGMDSAARALER